jgi:hypothetical protein
MAYARAATQIHVLRARMARELIAEWPVRLLLSILQDYMTRPGRHHTTFCTRSEHTEPYIR